MRDSSIYIIENNLKPGNLLPSEGQLADDLGVGRGSVREAVKSLQSLGIVDVQHGMGLSVRELNFDPMLETFKFGMQFNACTSPERIHPTTRASTPAGWTCCAPAVRPTLPLPGRLPRR